MPASTADPVAHASSTSANSFLAQHVEKLTLNQYWYSAPTIQRMIQEIESQTATNPKLRCAFLSTPSLYFSLSDLGLRQRSTLFDCDEQWKQLGEERYVCYDYRDLNTIPTTHHQQYDYVVIDPPFIVEEVWRCYAAAVALLLRRPSSSPQHQEHHEVKHNEQVINEDDDHKSRQSTFPITYGKMLLSTIPENASLLASLFADAKLQRFRPSIPHLPYQYSLYTNYPSALLNELNPEIDTDDRDLPQQPSAPPAVKDGITAAQRYASLGCDINTVKAEEMVARREAKTIDATGEVIHSSRKLPSRSQMT